MNNEFEVESFQSSQICCQLRNWQSLLFAALNTFETTRTNFTYQPAAIIFKIQRKRFHHLDILQI